ncbi:MAG: GTP-sensing pleiotropic transcriptional regulator CodY, partial [Clostridium sp.]|nr:GTP-sensing pleiotropic transcriptional regulator CodY [Clostridium sp.]
MSLLNKTRKLNKILQKSGTDPVIFDDICEILSEELDSDVYVVSRRGKILGHKFVSTVTSTEEHTSIFEDMKFSDDYNDVLLKIGETKTNLVADSRYILNMEEEYLGKNKVTTIVPINGNRERLGTLITVTLDKEYSDEDIVLMEYSATIIGLEILRSKQLQSEENQRKNDVVDLAINTLSYSEKEAVNHIFKELNGPEGLLVASRIADKVGITRSV